MQPENRPQVELERLLAIQNFLQKDARRILSLVAAHRDQIKTIECSIHGGSMESAIPRGSRIRIRVDSPVTYAKGQVIAFLAEEKIMVHRIIGRSRSQKYWLTRGDSLFLPDPPVPQDCVLGTIIEFCSDAEWRPPPGYNQASGVRGSCALVTGKLLAAIMAISVPLAARLIRMMQATRLGSIRIQHKPVSSSVQQTQAAGKIDIRPARSEDAHAIAQVDVETWSSTYAGILPDSYLASRSLRKQVKYWKEVIKKASARNECVFVAEESSRVVAYGWGGPARKPDSVFTGEVFQIYILRSHRHLGIGGTLMSLIAGFNASRGIHSMIGWIVARNSTSRAWLQALGGVFLLSEQRSMAGLMMEVSAYGWTDTADLVKRQTSYPVQV